MASAKIRARSCGPWAAYIGDRRPNGSFTMLKTAPRKFAKPPRSRRCKGCRDPRYCQVSSKPVQANRGLRSH